MDNSKKIAKGKKSFAHKALFAISKNAKVFDISIDDRVIHLKEISKHEVIVYGKYNIYVCEMNSDNEETYNVNIETISFCHVIKINYLDDSKNIKSNNKYISYFHNFPRIEKDYLVEEKANSLLGLYENYINNKTKNNIIVNIKGDIIIEMLLNEEQEEYIRKDEDEGILQEEQFRKGHIEDNELKYEKESKYKKYIDALNKKNNRKIPKKINLTEEEYQEKIRRIKYSYKIYEAG